MAGQLYDAKSEPSQRWKLPLFLDYMNVAELHQPILCGNRRSIELVGVDEPPHCLDMPRPKAPTSDTNTECCTCRTYGPELSKDIVQPHIVIVLCRFLIRSQLRWYLKTRSTADALLSY